MFLISLALAALMGYAIQRGATCTVAAMDEIVRARRATRLIAMLEASMWVAGLYLVAAALGHGVALPMGHSPGGLAILGGLLLGAGAYLNQACVFGAVARFGSGEWAYAATPAGFFAGAWAAHAAGVPAPVASLPSPLSAFPLALALAALLFMAWRVLPALVALLREKSMRDPLARRIHARLVQPAAATRLIGVTFFGLLVLEGAWAYTDVLNEAAMQRWQHLAPRLALFAALLGGAALGGWRAGLFRRVAPTAAAIGRCLLGGALMGAGSALIPGSNDGLILLGMPLLFAHAWIAFAAMCAAVVFLMAAAHRLRSA